MKKKTGVTLAIIVFIIILVIGIILGKYLATKYNEKHHTNYGVLDLLIVNNENKEEQKEVLSEGIKKISDLCETDTGLCDKDLGYLTLNGTKVDFKITYNFDNANEEINYFKLDDVKVGNFIKLNNFYVLNKEYLLVTEPKDNNNYLIHLYNSKGKEVKQFDGTYYNSEISLNSSEIYYYYCDASDLDPNNQKALHYYSIIDTNGTITNKEISKEYGKC